MIKLVFNECFASLSIAQDRLPNSGNVMKLNIREVMRHRKVQVSFQITCPIRREVFRNKFFYSLPSIFEV